jgi:type I restriction enzyme R subunit
VEAIGILLNRPKKWSTTALKELKAKLATTPERFTVDLLQKAHRIQYQKALDLKQAKIPRPQVSRTAVG